MRNSLIISFLILILGCTESIKPVDKAVENQILYIGNGTEPQDLDPHIVTGVPESKVLIDKVNFQAPSWQPARLPRNKNHPYQADQVPRQFQR